MEKIIDWTIDNVRTRIYYSEYHYPFGSVRVIRTVDDNCAYYETLISTEPDVWIMINCTGKISKDDSVYASDYAMCSLSTGITYLLTND